MYLPVKLCSIYPQVKSVESVLILRNEDPWMQRSSCLTPEKPRHRTMTQTLDVICNEISSKAYYSNRSLNYNAYKVSKRVYQLQQGTRLVVAVTASHAATALHKVVLLPSCVFRPADETSLDLPTSSICRTLTWAHCCIKYKYEAIVSSR